MQSVLDKFRLPSATFRPENARELFALQLAQKLNDARAVRHYVTLAESHTESQILCAYRRVRRATKNEDPSRLFNRELPFVRANGNPAKGNSLISIRVERRTVAAAIFEDDHLEYTDARQLSSVREKALDSAVGFINWMLNRFSVESAALETIPEAHDFQRRSIHETISAELRKRGLPIWEVPRAVLLAGCGQPPLKSRRELRQVATTIWPILAGTHARVFIQDAAILGLHVQIERRFIANN